MSSYDDEKVQDSGLTEREAETLPNWAQERIAGLRRERDELAKDLEDAQPVTDPTGIAFGDLRNSRPTFLPDGRFDYVHVQVAGDTGDPDGEWIAVSRKSDPSGTAYVEVAVPSGELVLRPQSLGSARVFAAHESDGNGTD